MFTYTLNGGSTATVSVTVTCADDPPTAVDDTATVVQDSAANAIDVLANDTDIDGGPMAIGSVDAACNGTVVITGGGTGLTYQPDANYCNDPPGHARHIHLHPDTAARPRPSRSPSPASTTRPPRSTTARPSTRTPRATAIDVLANDTDPDGGPKTIGSAGDPANGTVVITGGGTGLTYQPDPNYCNSPPGGTPDTFTYTLNGGSTATVSVTVTCVDDPPMAVNDAATVVEDAAATAVAVLTNDTDPDGGPMTIGSASRSGERHGRRSPAAGRADLSAGSELLQRPRPAASPDTFTYTLNGGSTATVSVTVTCAPDDPVVDNSAGNTSYTENAAATPIDSAVTVTDPDPGATITGATVQITGGYAGAEDVLALASSHPGITPSVSGDTLTLTGTASPAAYQAALRDVTYRNSSEAPSTAARTVTFTVTDETARTGSDTKGLTVVAVDDPPAAVNDSATVLEDAAATAVPVLTNDTDRRRAEDDRLGVGSGKRHRRHHRRRDGADLPAGPELLQRPARHDAGHVHVHAQRRLDRDRLDDGHLRQRRPGRRRRDVHGARAIGNTALVVNDPDDGAPSPTHPKKTISGDILAGDTDIDGPGPLTVTPGTFATNDGGSVTIESDGDFTFHPAASTSCTDTSDFFDYTSRTASSPASRPTRAA